MSDSRDDFIIALRYSLLKKGAKQKFSLFFLILFSISIIAMDKQSIAPINFVRATINDLVYRVTIVASTPGNLIVYLGSKTKEHLNIYSENKILKEEIEILKKDQFDNSYLKTENENLKIALGLEKVKISSEDSITVARVLVDQVSPFLKSVLTNKGTKHGVIKGMTVFSKNYLIGTEDAEDGELMSNLYKLLYGAVHSGELTEKQGKLDIRYQNIKQELNRLIEDTKRPNNSNHAKTTINYPGCQHSSGLL